MEELLRDYLQNYYAKGVKINYYEEVGTIINVTFIDIRYTPIPNSDYECVKEEQVNISDLLVWMYSKIKSLEERNQNIK